MFFKLFWPLRPDEKRVAARLGVRRPSVGFCIAFGCAQAFFVAVWAQSASPAPTLTPALTSIPSANAPADDAILEMAQAYKRKDSKRLEALLPQTSGHVLAPWAAYWRMSARLEDASAAEVQAFFARWANTYQEDRLRNDWLLLLGQRRDWASLEREYPRFRMNDDREVRCYVLWAQHVRDGRSIADEVTRLWYAQNELDEGCRYVVEQLYKSRQLHLRDVQHKLRLSVEANKPRLAQQIDEWLAPRAAGEWRDVFNAPMRVLAHRPKKPSNRQIEMALLALLRLADKDPEEAADTLQKKWRKDFNAEQLTWAWGAIGKQAAMRLSNRAESYFAQAPEPLMTDEHCSWRARAALRGEQWSVFLQSVAGMSEEARQDSTWVYWRARALLAIAAIDGERQDAARKEALALFQSIAGAIGFYEQLALEELGQAVRMPPSPALPSAAEKEWARRHDGLNRALYAIALGLRSEGVREWNYSVHVAQAGGMNDRELLAAASWACEREVWDRCINSSDRARGWVDWTLSFPLPQRELILRQAQEQGLDPAYVYGLIRQESRFIAGARSNVGAAGLMQVMPATAQWVAKRLALGGFRPQQIEEAETNVKIGTAYLKWVLDDVQGSLPMAAAAYNAGPGRPRLWRQGPVLEAAIWVENIPFAETRNYVKKVLSNTTSYAAVLSGRAQSLKQRLGFVGPRDKAASPEAAQLP